MLRNDTPSPAELMRVCAYASGAIEVASGPYGQDTFHTDRLGDRIKDERAVERQRHFGLALAGFIDALGEMDPEDALKLLASTMETKRARRYIRRAVHVSQMPEGCVAEVMRGGSPGHLVFRWLGRGGYISDDTAARIPGDPVEPSREWPTFESWIRYPSSIETVHIIASHLTDEQMRAIFAQPDAALRSNLAEHFALEQKFARTLALRGTP